MVVESESAENKTAEQPSSTMKDTREKIDETECYFLQKLEKISSNEEKVALLLEEMKGAISQEGKPNFKMFWKAKQLTLSLFKEPLHPIMRSQYWSQFIELSQEARNLKAHLEETTSFTLEQIELAIAGLKEDLQKYDLSSGQVGDSSFLETLSVSGFQKEDYLPLHRETTFLDRLASKTNGLRKEVMQVEMRSRDKNRFFKELSSIADLVFPKRRELIQAISEKFSQDVETFVQKNFHEGVSKQKPCYVLREEIKAIQALAKVFLLHAKVFTFTRKHLSECWNQLRAFEKERKKEFAKMRQESLEKIAGAKEKIKEFEKICQTTTNAKEMERFYEESLQWMRTLRLNREEERTLRHALDAAKAPFLEREKEEKEKEEKQKKEMALKKKECLQTLKERIHALLKTTDLPIEELIVQQREIREKLLEFSLSGQEKQLFDRLIFSLDGMVEDQKILSSPEGESLQQHREMLAQKKKRQGEIKKQLEEYRKTMNSSGMDFEKAMAYQELIEMEKMRLEKIEEEIQEVEEKIYSTRG